jgi:hypothetical protein
MRSWKLGALRAADFLAAVLLEVVLFAAALVVAALFFAGMRLSSPVACEEEAR